MDCIFCKIAKGDVGADIVFEDENIIAFNDTKPIAPVHVLIIPKKHIPSVAQLSDGDDLLMGKIIMKAKDIAEELGISEDGYKLLLRVGKNGGQEIPHIHLHLLGGAELYEEIRPK